MKIGILTLHYGCNYGGILQCYALQTFLESLGHNVEVINYIPSMHVSLFKRILGKLKTITSISDLFHNIKDFSKVQSKVNKPSKINRKDFKKIFDIFRANRLKLSQLVNEDTIHNIQNNYDAVIVGSDQVWTSLYGKRQIYFFDWLDNNYRGKRIAYAACSAHQVVRGKSRKILEELLSKMDAIGVRDNTTKLLVSSVNPAIKTTLVTDPTLLYNFDEFNDNKKITFPYILTYILGTEIDGGHKQALKRIKEVVGNIAVISVIIPDMSSGIEKFSDEILSDVTPEQWVTLIRNAAAIYTDSFHGVIFSLKFHKVFFAYYANAIRASRLIDLKQCFPTLPIYKNIPQQLNITYEWNNIYNIEFSKEFIISQL